MMKKRVIFDNLISCEFVIFWCYFCINLNKCNLKKNEYFYFKNGYCSVIEKKVVWCEIPSKTPLNRLNWWTR